MFKQVRLETRDGALVAHVTIPKFDSTPDLLMWGSRFFGRAHGTLDVYTERFCVAVVPIPGVAKNDGTDEVQ